MAWLIERAPTSKVLASQLVQPGYRERKVGSECHNGCGCISDQACANSIRIAPLRRAVDLHCVGRHAPALGALELNALGHGSPVPNGDLGQIAHSTPIELCPARRLAKRQVKAPVPRAAAITDARLAPADCTEQRRARSRCRVNADRKPERRTVFASATVDVDRAPCALLSEFDFHGRLSFGSTLSSGFNIASGRAHVNT